MHKLHDAQDKRLIHLDDRLTQLFKTETSPIDFTRLPQLIQHQLSTPDPIVIDYTIRVDKQFHRSNTAYDIDVELDNVARQRMMNAVAATQLQKDVMALDDKIVQCVQSINNSKIKRDFLTQFCVNPIEFINKWITSQARDLEVRWEIGLNE